MEAKQYHKEKNINKSNTTLKIGLLTPHDPYDRNSFSGTIYYMHMAMRENPALDVYVIARRLHRSMLLKRLLSISSRFGPYAYRAAYSIYTKLFASWSELELIRKNDIDIIIAPVASSTLAHFKYSEYLPPIIFITDATPGFIKETYNEHTSKRALLAEQMALETCTSVVYSSRFMAERALEEFPDSLKHNTSKISVIPFGLNIDTPPIFASPKRLTDRVELLFVGKFWERKGGDIALETLIKLHERGINCRLTIIGCSPPNLSQSEAIIIHPYLDKNSASDRKIFHEIQTRSHFLILPTRGDCTPMVIAEANAFGTPVICSDVGGISSLVDDGSSGKLMKLNDGATKYADTIIELTRNEDIYSRYSQGARRVFETKLNWQSWSRSFLELANHHLQRTEICEEQIKHRAHTTETKTLLTNSLETTESVV